MNANCLHNIFKFNCTSHERRSVKLIQPKRRNTSYGLRSFSYLGSKLWNDIVNSDPGIANCDFDDLMDFLKHWEGPNMNEGFPYVWHFTRLNVLLFYGIFTFILLCYELLLRSSITFMCISPLHCIYHAPSRILAFWLMLSILCTTINKVYLILRWWFETPSPSLWSHCNGHWFINYHTGYHGISCLVFGSAKKSETKWSISWYFLQIIFQYRSVNTYIGATLVIILPSSLKTMSGHDVDNIKE